MKKITNYFKLCAALILFMAAQNAKAQCASSFNTSTWGNGTVGFTATAVGATPLNPGVFSWNFGDGATATGQSTFHTYANGDYTATLTYTNAALNCSSTAVYTISICNLYQAGFTSTVTNTPGVVNFARTTFGTNANTTYSWNYGDGSPTVNTPTNTHTYANGGTYTVTLTFGDTGAPNCTSTYTATVNVCYINPTITYTLNPNGAVNFNVASAMTNTATNYYWVFNAQGPFYNSYAGSGNAGANPNFTYNYNGPQTVSVNISNTSPFTCGAQQVFTINITNVTNPCSLNASFYTNGNNGQLNFVNASTGTVAGTSYSWNFGDGSPVSTQTSPSHSYTAIGVYIATLTANNNFSYTCVSTNTQYVIVNALPSCSLSLSLGATPGNNGTCTFSSIITGTNANTTYSWNYGDNTGSTTINSPHTYSANGTYTVSLTLANNPTCTVTQSVVVTITNICNLSAAFTASLGNNGIVYFTNTSTGTIGTTTYFWNFGDGSTSTLTAPSHTYTNGTYAVILYALNQSPGCSNTATQVITVTSGSCIANAGFTLYPSGIPQLWFAGLTFPNNNITSATWNWGDGSSSNTLYTSHTYSAAGNYSICLSVTVSCGASNTSCTSYNIYRPNGTLEDLSMVQINVIDPAAVGIENTFSEGIAFTVSPNPNNGSFNLNLAGLSNGNASVKVYNLVGQQVYNLEAEVSDGSISKEIALDHVSNGVYFIKVTTHQQTLTKKIVISRN